MLRKPGHMINALAPVRPRTSSTSLARKRVFTATAIAPSRAQAKYSTK